MVPAGKSGIRNLKLRTTKSRNFSHFLCANEKSRKKEGKKRRKVYCRGFSLLATFWILCPAIICHFLMQKLFAGGKRNFPGRRGKSLRIFTLAAVHTVYNHYYLCRLNPQLLKRSHKELPCRQLPRLIFICIRWQMKSFQFLMSSRLSSASKWSRQVRLLPELCTRDGYRRGKMYRK